MLNFIGANWKTSVFGAITMAALFIVGNPDLISGVIGDTNISKRIFSVAALISGFVAFSQAKDKNVTGGMIQQTKSGAVADAGTQTMVDQTVIASVKSGDTTVTPEEKAKATS